MVNFNLNNKMCIVLKKEKLAFDTLVRPLALNPFPCATEHTKFRDLPGLCSMAKTYINGGLDDRPEVTGGASKY
jgi:hypothetical protein